MGVVSECLSVCVLCMVVFDCFCYVFFLFVCQQKHCLCVSEVSSSSEIQQKSLRNSYGTPTENIIEVLWSLSQYGYGQTMIMTVATITMMMVGDDYDHDHDDEDQLAVELCAILPLSSAFHDDDDVGDDDDDGFTSTGEARIHWMVSLPLCSAFHDDDDDDDDGDGE